MRIGEREKGSEMKIQDAITNAFLLMISFHVILIFQCLNFEHSLRLVCLCISHSVRPWQTSVKYLGAKGTH